ncbi:MAG: sigma 54-interacting transcriptional regulator [Saprospiraceae bacterium]|nr:sigma 54-interacting transcriptional regulator [Saprospiraceae bacterium]MCB9325578.1 sigma 54-interacting transcriptional regulator [Lewinellaceae bacterium]
MAVKKNESSNNPQVETALRKTADIIQNGILFLDERGYIQSINRSMQKMLGYKPDARLPKTIFEINPSLTLRNWKKFFGDLVQQGHSSVEIEIITAEEDIFQAAMQGILLDADALKTCMIVMEGKALPSPDQNSRPTPPMPRNDTEMSLAHHTINQAREIIYWMDHKGKLIFVNNTFCKKLKISKQEALLSEPDMFFPDFELEKFKEEWALLKKDKEISRESLIKKSGEATIPVEVSITLFSSEGKEYYCAILRDISERKKLEAQRELRVEEIEKLRQQLASDNAILKEEIELRYPHKNIISQSDNYKNVIMMAQQVAPTDTTVLVTGETGTGKELIANMIHALSKRSDRVLVKVNCAALPATLIESELFGHEKGAFTGATQQKKGRFELADKGTLFLDEVGDLPLELQPKLLRILQEGEFTRVGGTKTIKVDVRVIAATNQNLETLVHNGKYREDLYYRLNVFPIHNLPLRERREDIPLLIKHFVDKYSKHMGKRIEKIPKSTVIQLYKYEFPGNIRELENIVERAIILSTGNRLQLGASFSPVKKKYRSKLGKKFKSLDEAQKVHILKALERCNWKVSGADGAAVLLDIHPKTLWSRMKKLDIRKN